MISAERRETALRGIQADVLTLRRKDKEDVSGGGSPTLHLHGMGYFLLDLSIAYFVRRISAGIYPRTTQGSATGKSIVRGVVLCIVMVETRTTNITEIAQDQTVIGCADGGASGFPEDGICLAGATHDRPTMVGHIGLCFRHNSPTYFREMRLGCMNRCRSLSGH